MAHPSVPRSLGWIRAVAYVKIVTCGGPPSGAPHPRGGPRHVDASNSRRTRVLVVSLAALAAVLLAGGLTAWGSLKDDSSSTKTVRRVGLMHVGLDHVPKSLDGITAGLEEFGWVDGKNIKLIWRNLDKDAGPRIRRTRSSWRASTSSWPSRTRRSTPRRRRRSSPGLRSSSSTPPIRFEPDWSDSLASPGANLTGVFGARDLVARHLELYTQLVPGLDRVLDARRPRRHGHRVRPGGDTDGRQATRRRARHSQATEAADIKRVFRSLRPGKVDGGHAALRVAPAQPHGAHASSCEDARACPSRRTARTGSSRARSSRTAPTSIPIGFAGARYVDSILDGTKPSDLAVQEIPDVEFALNLDHRAAARDQDSEAEDRRGRRRLPVARTRWDPARRPCTAAPTTHLEVRRARRRPRRRRVAHERAHRAVLLVPGQQGRARRGSRARRRVPRPPRSTSSWTTILVQLRGVARPPREGARRGWRSGS